MQNSQDDDQLLDELFPTTRYADRKQKNTRNRKYKWQQVEIALERLKLKRELLTYSHYH